MNKYISDYIKNNTKTVFLDLSVSQKRTINVLFKSIFKSGSGILRHLGDNFKILPKTMGEKFSHHLGNVNLQKKVEELADRKIMKVFPKNGIIAYDLTDINKDKSQKTEKISGCFDGSKRQKSRGFFVHGVGFGKFLWRLELHDNLKNYLNQIREKIIEEIFEKTKYLSPIFAFDRGNDHKILFEFLAKKSIKFIIRLKKNRNIILKKTGEILKNSELYTSAYAFSKLHAKYACSRVQELSAYF